MFIIITLLLVSTVLAHDPVDGIHPTNEEEWIACCGHRDHDDCHPCNIETHTNGAIINGELVGKARIYKMFPVQNGNVEYCCDAAKEGAYQCIFYQRPMF